MGYGYSLIKILKSPTTLIFPLTLLDYGLFLNFSLTLITLLNKTWKEDRNQQNIQDNVMQIGCSKYNRLNKHRIFKLQKYIYLNFTNKILVWHIWLSKKVC